jgi:hypothetical protein
VLRTEGSITVPPEYKEHVEMAFVGEDMNLRLVTSEKQRSDNLLVGLLISWVDV